MRNISDNGLHFTAAWEQFRGTAYKATPAEKYYTIGYGHYGPDVESGQKITEGQALLLLNRDMAKAVAVVDQCAPRDITVGQFDALCDLVFNVGPGALSAQTGTGMAVRQGDWDTVRAKLALFVNQAGKPVLGLKRRAAGRIALFDGMSWKEAEQIGRAIKS